MKEDKSVRVYSEIGDLEGVILHTPGPEVENMTPGNAERALYSDILNLAVSRREHEQLEGVLKKITQTFQVKDLLSDILTNEKVKDSLIQTICINESINGERDKLMNMGSDDLARQLIEGVVMTKDTLTKYLSKQRYSLRPLHNFFFTRDASVTVRDKVLISRMANKVRERESIIMEAIFDFHPEFKTVTVNPVKEGRADSTIKIEGGDVLIGREDVLLIGIGARTSPQGIDYVLDKIKDTGQKRHIIVQELPLTPESFIHLDMVFTFLSQHECMVYEPVILKPNRLQTVLITIENGKVVSIREKSNILQALKQVGIDLKPIYCGGTKDPWIQEREQWHSGANFFATGPGKVIGYGRNTYTIDELAKNGFEVLPAMDIINNKIDPKVIDKYVITLDGSELPRGGGGARCMTMPVRRKEVKW